MKTSEFWGVTQRIFEESQCKGTFKSDNTCFVR